MIPSTFGRSRRTVLEHNAIICSASQQYHALLFQTEGCGIFLRGAAAGNKGILKTHKHFWFQKSEKRRNHNRWSSVVIPPPPSLFAPVTSLKLLQPSEMGQKLLLDMVVSFWHHDIWCMALLIGQLQRWQATVGVTRSKGPQARTRTWGCSCYSEDNPLYGSPALAAELTGALSWYSSSCPVTFFVSTQDNFLANRVSGSNVQYITNCNIICYNTIWYDRIRYEMIRYDTIWCNMIQKNTSNSTTPHKRIQYNTLLYNVMRYEQVMYDTDR